MPDGRSFPEHLLSACCRQRLLNELGLLSVLENPVESLGDGEPQVVVGGDGVSGPARVDAFHHGDKPGLGVPEGSAPGQGDIVRFLIGLKSWRQEVAV